MDASKLIVRKAKPDDWENIINIDKEGKLYDGLDYIPLWIRPLTQDKASNGFVSEIDGQIVSIRICYLLNTHTVPQEITSVVNGWDSKPRKSLCYKLIESTSSLISVFLNHLLWFLPDL